MSDLLVEGLHLAMYGMGTVFVFLTLLVGATMLRSLLIGKTEPLPDAALDGGTLAAIAAAIHQYRQR